MPSGILEKAYFATMTMYWNSQLIFTEAGYMNIQGGEGLIYNLTNVDPGSNETFYHIARIDYDGVFRIYKHFRKEDTTESGGSCPSSWTAVQSIPDNICSGGLCGPNSICSTSDGMAFCLCPAEFSPLYQSGYWAGCKPNFALPSCHDGWEANKELVDFVKLKNVDWPFSDYSSLQGDGVDEASCTQQCLDDCLCVVALYEDKAKYCWKMRYPLSNGIQNPNITKISLIKVSKANGSANKKDRSTVVVVLAVLLGSSAFLNILLFLVSSAAVYYLYHKKLNLPWNIDRTFATN
ncbi:G-type lectin S-receptor-like serine/threonine-protein kinase LECRK3, partial [Fagus crenata]